MIRLSRLTAASRTSIPIGHAGGLDGQTRAPAAVLSVKPNPGREMQQLLERVRSKLQEEAFPNEAAVSFGIVVPVLQALGWDPTEPEQVMPEFTTGKGRVDFALCSAPKRPAVFIEVKGVGRSLEGDRQLFEYAFHAGVPLCVLTDGREWNFYLPSGQGNYEDRRVYRLQLDERDPAAAEEALRRYLQRDRVRSGEAREAADSDYRDKAAKREAARCIPTAWSQLVEAPEDLLVELVSDQVESLSGFRPVESEVVSFLRGLVTSDGRSGAAPVPAQQQLSAAEASFGSPHDEVRRRPRARTPMVVQVFGERLDCRNGNRALVEVLQQITSRDPAKLPALAAAARGRNRNHIARDVAEIYPNRPDLAQAEEFADGWLVGLNIANREKVRLVRAACDVYGLRFGTDVVFDLPNS